MCEYIIRIWECKCEDKEKIWECDLYKENLKKPYSEQKPCLIEVEEDSSTGNMKCPKHYKMQIKRFRYKVIKYRRNN